MIPILGITGYSGSGKTTLLEQLLPALADHQLRVSVIKHSHHHVNLDKPGKDSWRMTQAGAAQVMMVCDQRWALLNETPSPVSLDYLRHQFDPYLTDLVLVEGFKQEPIAKIMLHRQGMAKPLPELDENVIALATDYEIESPIPRLDLNNIEQIAKFIAEFVQHNQQKCG